MSLQPKFVDRPVGRGKWAAFRKDLFETLNNGKAVVVPDAIADNAQANMCKQVRSKGLKLRTATTEQGQRIAWVERNGNRDIR